MNLQPSRKHVFIKKVPWKNIIMISGANVFLFCWALTQAKLLINE
jgi:hypothetical protein